MAEREFYVASTSLRTWRKRRTSLTSIGLTKTLKTSSRHTQVVITTPAIKIGTTKVPLDYNKIRRDVNTKIIKIYNSLIRGGTDTVPSIHSNTGWKNNLCSTSYQYYKQRPNRSRKVVLIVQKPLQHWLRLAVAWASVVGIELVVLD